MAEIRNPRDLQLLSTTPRLIPVTLPPNVNIDLGNVNGAGNLAGQDTVSTNQVTGLGALALLNSVGLDRVTGTGALASQDTVNLTTQVTGALTTANISGLGALALLNVVNLNTQVTGALSYTAINGLGNLATQNAVNGYTQVTNLGNLAYANAIAANQIGAGTLAAGVVYAGKISASSVDGGTLSGITIAIGTGGLVATAGGMGRRFFVDSSGYTHIDTLRIYGSIQSYGQILIDTSAGAPALQGRNTSSGSTAAGIEGYNTRAVTRGSVGYAGGHAFYAHAGGYGPFTGAHDALIDKAIETVEGDIVTDDVCVSQKSVSDSIFTALLAAGVNNRRAIGVVAGRIPLAGAEPAALVSNAEPVYSREDPERQIGMLSVVVSAYDELADTYDLLTVNALGEGQINVCGRGGDIDAGDLVVCSDMPGKGQRQADDVVRSYTVAKAREAVTFSGPDEVKLVPCIYLCG